ncbi:tyrosine-protein kinase JAK2-like isoform X2 [Oratosquilla oratoria]|uniref:tyrosine-protein kinase JAK2-like isoform X2 n=1 Tax=Oratosquilla oratoria TaxID=337810 RepID=UPI003F757C5B
MIKIIFHGTHEKLEITDLNKNVEDLVISSAQHCGITPVCQHLFGLYSPNDETFLGLYRQLSQDDQGSSYHFRLRFYPTSLESFKELDDNACLYFFHQVREDFLDEKMPVLIANREDGLGLVVTDIFRHILQNPGLGVKDVDFKKFVPKSLNSFPNRRNVRNHVEKLVRDCEHRDFAFVCKQYLDTVEKALQDTHYFAEEYEVQMNSGEGVVGARVLVDVHQSVAPHLQYNTSRREGVWKSICCIEELVFVSLRPQDCTVELSRQTGIPCNLKFPSRNKLDSFVGLISGYYRFMKTWTFDLCREMVTPSLKFLKSHRCHGPVGSEFSKQKLKDKGRGEAGIGLLRQSTSRYNTYKLDVIRQEDEIKSYVILSEGAKVWMEGRDETTHENLSSLLKSIMRSEGSEINLTRIIPPFDSDKPSLLHLCSRTLETAPEDTSTAPQILHFKSSREKDTFLNAMNKYTQISCDSLVTIMGIILSPLALVMEYLPLGSFDRYLKEHGKLLQQVDLVEATTYLARALWYLNSEGLVHNNIRCHNILVVEHTQRVFKVKLSDPGKIEYSLQDIHWIPREYHTNPPQAINNPTTDIWAFATTVWQIFSMGVKPLMGVDVNQVQALYSQGSLLPRPTLCPQELYQVMVRCWFVDPQVRRQPQEIMRDVHQILYQVSNSHSNPYQMIAISGSNSDDQYDDDDDDDEGYSVSTHVTTISCDNGSTTQVTLATLPAQFSCNLDPMYGAHQYPHLDSRPWDSSDGEIYYNDRVPLLQHENQETSLGNVMLPLHLAQRKTDPISNELIKIEKSCVRIEEKIGQGNYGIVYSGTMISENGSKIEVAVKQMRAQGQLEDFEREIEMMKTLNHNNIIKLYGITENNGSGSEMNMVMEYMRLGSLNYYIEKAKDTRKELIEVPILLKFAEDIAQGMAYLENKDIIHRDLAARNVLVASETCVKITDFGLAQRPNQGNYYILKTERPLPIAWYALESLELNKFSHKSDVWSYGVTCWEMFTHGQQPWPHLLHSAEKLIKTLKQGIRLNAEKPCPVNIYSKLIRPCWEDDTSRRPDFLSILSTITELQEENEFH